MPAEVDLLKLARVYLTNQAKLWPELLKAGVLEPPTEAVLLRMATELKARQLGGELPPIPGDPASVMKGLFAAYLRYSDKSSNPRSLDAQLTDVLDKAAGRRHFIPWQFVYADVELSGLIWGRRGYTCVNKLLGSKDHERVRGVYLYDFSRGGRDPTEWFRFAGRCRNRRKNVLGAADGFELQSLMGEAMLHVFAMFQTFFVTLLRKKVRDGLNMAADQGTSTGRPPLGYGLVPKLDANGNPVTGRDGAGLNEWAIHWPAMKYVIWAFQARGERRRSCHRIAKQFNRWAVGGSRSWDGSNIAKLLKRPIYIGVRSRTALIRSVTRRRIRSWSGRTRGNCGGSTWCHTCGRRRSVTSCGSRCGGSSTRCTSFTR